MSKAVLVIDMPKSCEDCKLCYDGINCALNGWVVFNDSGQTNRDKGCPLKPMPEKKEELYYPHSEYEIAVNEGYNDCIDEILGEEDATAN